MPASTGATETWGSRPGMSVVKTTPRGFSSWLKALQASTMREPPRTALDGEDPLPKAASQGEKGPRVATGVRGQRRRHEGAPHFEAESWVYGCSNPVRSPVDPFACILAAPACRLPARVYEVQKEENMTEAQNLTRKILAEHLSGGEL